MGMVRQSRLTVCWQCEGETDLALPVSAGTWVRLDAIGGAAGDMFVAAAVSTWPELAERVCANLAALAIPFPYDLDWPIVNRGGIMSHQFVLNFDGHAAHPTGSVAEIKAFLKVSALSPEVRSITIGLFDLIAAAEGEVHGVPADDVHLHEIADWDSIADLVAAATVIDAVGPAVWVCPSLPLGSGSVKCAHGLLPVPAPATVVLCKGARMRSDGVDGERVTPTGAAILAYLRAFDPCGLRSGRLIASGHGAGTKTFSGLPNVLRLLVFEAEEPSEKTLEADQVAVLSFDIDDQSPEDLAIGLDRLRAVDGVLSATCVTATGKKGRVCFRIEVLGESIHVNSILNACVRETTTLGVRWRIEDRWKVARRAVEVQSAEYGPAPIKIASRPGGISTAKLEADFVAGLDLPLHERQQVRGVLESQGLSIAGEEVDKT